MKYLTGASRLTVDFHGAKLSFFRGEVLPEHILPYLGEEQCASLSDAPVVEKTTPRKKRQRATPDRRSRSKKRT